MNPCIERPISLLRHVLEIHPRKRQAYGLGSRLTAGGASCDTGDTDVIQLNYEVILLLRVAISDRRFLDVPAVGACLQEQRRGLVDLMDESEIVERRSPPPPPPIAGAETGCVTPHENDSTSISSLCAASSHSPGMPGIFAKMSNPIWTSLRCCRLTDATA